MLHEKQIIADLAKDLKHKNFIILNKIYYNIN